MSSLANPPESVPPPLLLKEALLEWLRDMQASDGRTSLRDRLEIAELIESGRFDAMPLGSAGMEWRSGPVPSDGVYVEQVDARGNLAVLFEDAVTEPGCLWLGPIPDPPGSLLEAGE